MVRCTKHIDYETTQGKNTQATSAYSTSQGNVCPMAECVRKWKMSSIYTEVQPEM